MCILNQMNIYEMEKPIVILLTLHTTYKKLFLDSLNIYTEIILIGSKLKK